MNSTFELYEELTGVVSLDISGSDVEVLVRRLGGYSELVGVDSKILK